MSEDQRKAFEVRMTITPGDPIYDELTKVTGKARYRLALAILNHHAIKDTSPVQGLHTSSSETSATPEQAPTSIANTSDRPTVTPALEPTHAEQPIADNRAGSASLLDDLQDVV